MDCCLLVGNYRDSDLRLKQESGVVDWFIHLDGSWLTIGNNNLYTL